MQTKENEPIKAPEPGTVYIPQPISDAVARDPFLLQIVTCFDEFAKRGATPDRAAFAVANIFRSQPNEAAGE